MPPSVYAMYSSWFSTRGVGRWGPEISDLTRKKQKKRKLGISGYWELRGERVQKSSEGPSLSFGQLLGCVCTY